MISAKTQVSDGTWVYLRGCLTKWVGEGEKFKINGGRKVVLCLQKEGFSYILWVSCGLKW